MEPQEVDKFINAMAKLVILPSRMLDLKWKNNYKDKRLENKDKEWKF